MSTVETIHKIKYFIVERARTARRFIKLTKPSYRIDELTILEITQEDDNYIQQCMQWLESGHDVGLISESGMPAIADPGSKIISRLHNHNIKIKPCVGPSSILLGLAASGLNGQNFTFHGYLPIKENQLKSKLKTLEAIIQKTSQSQIFIETPYRNDRLMGILLKSLSSKIKLCLAIDITGKNESIITKTIHQWKNAHFPIGKVPCLFILGK